MTRRRLNTGWMVGFWGVWMGSLGWAEKWLESMMNWDVMGFRWAYMGVYASVCVYVCVWCLPLDPWWQPCTQYRTSTPPLDEFACDNHCKWF